MLTLEEWQAHNEWERNWWHNCANTFEEQLKQETYVKYLKLNQFALPGHWFDLKGKSVFDVGGGPISLLLRCKNFSEAVVVDPCPFPEWVADRYECAGITYLPVCAEDYIPIIRFDEAWIYNCLQHVMNPEKIIDMVIHNARKVRIFEYIEVGECPGHPHNLTEEMLDDLFQRQGLTDRLDGLAHGKIYFGVFNYG